MTHYLQVRTLHKIHKITINETVEEPEAEPPAWPGAQQPGQVVFTHLHDSPMIRKISVLMDMISTMQGEMAKLTKEVNDLVRQHATNQSLYRTVDQTHVSSPTLNQSRGNEAPQEEAAQEEVPENDEASMVRTLNTSNSNLPSPASELPDL